MHVFLPVDRALYGMSLRILTLLEALQGIRPSADPTAAWWLARDEAALAYRAWADAPPSHRRQADAVYLAVADREAAAAERWPPRAL
jgi:hypothetical protein